MAVQVTSVKLDTRVLDRMTAQIRPRAEGLVKSAAFAISGEAAKRAPVDTAALANSIHPEQQAQFLWRIQDGVEYGVYQELGFRHFGSGAFIQNPFMIPAVEFIRPHFERQWGALFI